MSVTAPTTPEAPVPALLRYFDVALLLVAAPILLLIGVSALGYCVGAAAWIALRLVGVAVDRATDTVDARTQITLRMGYMMGRLFLLALAVILARSDGGRDAGLAALVVVVVAFTVELSLSAITRPRRAK